MPGPLLFLIPIGAAAVGGLVALVASGPKKGKGKSPKVPIDNKGGGVPSTYVPYVKYVCPSCPGGFAYGLRPELIDKAYNALPNWYETNEIDVPEGRRADLLPRPAGGDTNTQLAAQVDQAVAQGMSVLISPGICWPVAGARSITCVRADVDPWLFTSPTSVLLSAPEHWAQPPGPKQEKPVPDPKAPPASGFWTYLLRPGELPPYAFAEAYLGAGNGPRYSELVAANPGKLTRTKTGVKGWNYGTTIRIPATGQNAWPDPVTVTIPLGGFGGSVQPQQAAPPVEPDPGSDLPGGYVPGGPFDPGSGGWSAPPGPGPGQPLPGFGGPFIVAIPGQGSADEPDEPNPPYRPRGIPTPGGFGHGTPPSAIDAAVAQVHEDHGNLSTAAGPYTGGWSPPGAGDVPLVPGMPVGLAGLGGWMPSLGDIPVVPGVPIGFGFGGSG